MKSEIQNPKSKITRRGGFLLTILGLLILSPEIQGQGKKDEFSDLGDEPFTITANHVELINTTQGRMTVLDSSVVIVHGTATITSDHGEAYEMDERAVLTGRVKMVDRGRTLTSEQATYFKKDKRAEMMGNVVLVDSGQTLNSDRLAYFREDERAEADGRVRLESKDGKTVVTGSHGVYEEKTKYGLMVGMPRLLLRDDKRDTTLIIDSEKMEVFNQEDRALAQGHVVMTRKGNKARCDRLEYFRKEERALLTGKPVAEEGENTLSGKEMEIFFKDNKISKVVVKENALARETPKDTAAARGGSEVRGDTLTMFVVNDTLEHTEVRGRAYSVYYPREKDKGKEGKNVSRGDSINIYFGEGKIKRVEIAGGAKGVYFIPKKKTGT